MDIRAGSPTPPHDVGCACARCVMSRRRAAAMERPLPIPGEGDTYVEEGLVVFTARYHLRRGYCCGNDCRHCPFDDEERAVALRRPS